MITYRKMQIKGEETSISGLWYARPVISDTLDTAALAKHMSKHNTPFSPGVIKGVLTDMIACIKELILDGKNVKLDDLAIFSVAIFSVGIVSDHGAESAEAFKVSEHVKGLKLRARATGELSNAQINLEGQLREATPYSVGGSGGSTPGGSEEEEDGGGGALG